jgi:hypothetical protein
MWRNWYLRCRDFASIKRWLILWPFTVYYGKSGVRLRKKENSRVIFYGVVPEGRRGDPAARRD